MDVDFLKYQFEDGYDGVIVKTKFKIGVRHVQMLYMFVCSLVMGIMRGSTSVAVMAMNDPTRQNETYIQMHNWDSRAQGAIMSAFFWGYALMMVPAEVYLCKVFGKHVMGAVLLVNGALTAAMPTIANEGGWIAVCNCQFLLGMSQACLCPVNQSLLTKWLPPSERKWISGLIYSGIPLGIILGLPLSGLISEAALGWELVYYSQAMMTLSMSILWILLTSNSPGEHQAVGDAEKEFIRESLSYYKKKDDFKPWRSIISSPQFWALAVAHVASNIMYVFFLVDVPAYLQTAGSSLKDSSWKATLPFISLWLMYMMTAPVVERLYRIGFISYVISLTNYRKLINALGATAVVIGLTVLPNLLPEWETLGLFVLTGTLGVIGLQFSGFLECHREISENYSGSVLMMSSAVSSMAAALVPILTGVMLTDHTTNLQRWHGVLVSLSCVFVFCNLVYTGLGTSERQSWDEGGTQYMYGYKNSGMDTRQMELEEIGDSKTTQQNDINAL